MQFRFLIKYKIIFGVDLGVLGGFVTEVSSVSLLINEFVWEFNDFCKKKSCESFFSVAW